MDRGLIEELLGQIEDADSDASGKKALSSLDDPQNGPKDDGGEGPADPDGSNADDVTRPKADDSDDKLAALVASLTPEEKAKLLALLQAPAGAPPGKPVAGEET